jgi:DNA-binding CsgD family transcriptional regulator
VICIRSSPEAAALAAALDCLSVGLFLIDQTRCIIHANASARSMLNSRSVLCELNGKLVACEARAALALRRIVGKLEGGAAAGRSAIALPLRANDGEHCIAHVRPLAMGPGRHVGTRDRAVVAVLVHKLVLAPLFPSEAVAGLYGLTAGEMRVLMTIVAVGGVRETAQALGIGEATVKTHLHRLFGKTGATRQADLVKLVAGFANPVVGGSCALPRRRAPSTAQRTQGGHPTGVRGYSPPPFEAFRPRSRADPVLG